MSGLIITADDYGLSDDVNAAMSSRCPGGRGDGPRIRAA